MRYISKILCLSLLSVLCACTDKKQTDSDVTIIPVDIDRDNPVPMSAMFDSVDVIILEGNRESYMKFLLGMTVENDHFYFPDQQVVFIFDKQGNFVSSSRKRHGRGDKEYRNVNGFYVLANGNIGIVDPLKITEYDYNFDFVRTLNIAPTENQGYLGNALAISEDKYLTYSDKDNITQMSLYSVSEDKIVKTNAFDWKYPLMNGSSFTPSFQKSNGQLYFRPDSQVNSLYFFDPQTLTYAEKYRYDLGKYEFDPSILLTVDNVMAYAMEYMPTTDKAFLGSAAINDNYLVASISAPPRSGKDKLSVVRLDNGKQFVFNNPFEGGWKIPYINFIDNEAIYVLTNTYTDIDTYADPALMSPAARERLASVNDDTNAVIFKYYLRKNIGE